MRYIDLETLDISIYVYFWNHMYYKGWATKNQKNQTINLLKPKKKWQRNSATLLSLLHINFCIVFLLPTMESVFTNKRGFSGKKMLYGTMGIHYLFPFSLYNLWMWKRGDPVGLRKKFRSEKLLGFLEKVMEWYYGERANLKIKKERK